MTSPKTFLEVINRDCCRYIGDDKSFCGNERDKKSSYCVEHHKRCCTKPKNIPRTFDEDKSSILY